MVLFVILHCCSLGKIATGGVAAKITVLNIAMNLVLYLLPSLKKHSGEKESKTKLVKICYIHVIEK